VDLIHDWLSIWEVEAIRDVFHDVPRLAELRYFVELGNGLRLLKCAIKTLFEDLDDVVFGL
jgi:hypothetical protein